VLDRPRILAMVGLVRRPGLIGRDPCSARRWSAERLFFAPGVLFAGVLMLLLDALIEVRAARAGSMNGVP